MKQFQFCVCDGGLGMVRRIQGPDTGCLALTMPSIGRWWQATAPGPRCQALGAWVYLLREFVTINGGSLRLVANTGYWCQEASNLTRNTLSAEFPGTLIQVKLLVRDDVTYSFADEGGSYDACDHRC
jgi:hypothetical protein